MRLIDVHTLKLHEFVGSHLLRVDYAVLSHTWGDDEVTFQDMQNLNKTVRAKKGFPKILQAAKLAKADGLPWVWVDTCCIDKTSSAELSEAINSMYMWYYRSSICYAYLVDVDSHPPVEDDASQFMRSRWFTRGWTLQELIAPRQVTFHAKDWKRIGEKLLVLPPASIVPSMLWGEKGKSALCRASCIPRAVLFEGRPIEQYCVAQRMSWASKRVCTRVEDTAYSLLGLFGINMPLLYGEENKAFIRLQEEIIKATDDHSIYAWTIPEDVPKGSQHVTHLPWTPHPVLALSPRYFLKSGNVVATWGEEGELSGLTKHGLRIQLSLRPSRLESSLFPQALARVQMSWAPLNCRLRYSARPLGLVLIPIKASNSKTTGQIHFYRLGTPSNLTVPVNDTDEPLGIGSSLTTIYIRQKVDWPDLMATTSMSTFQFRNIPVQIPIEVAQARSHEFVFLPGAFGVQDDGPPLIATIVSPNTELHWSRTFDTMALHPGNEVRHLFLIRREGFDIGLMVGIQKEISWKHLRVTSAVVSLEMGDKWRRLGDIVDGAFFEDQLVYTFPWTFGNHLSDTFIQATLDCEEDTYGGMVSRRIYTLSFATEDVDIKDIKEK